MPANPVGRYGNDGINDVAGVGMVLTHADEAVARAVQRGVGVTQGARRRDGQRRFPALLSVNALVLKVGKPHPPPVGQPRPAAVFMHSGAGVERRRVDIEPVAVGSAADDDIAPALGRPRL